MADKNNMIAGLYETFAFEVITIATLAKGLTEDTFTTKTADEDPQVALRAILTIENAQLRYRMDGENPTSSVGHILNVMDTLTIIGNQNMLNFRAIRTGTNNSKISVSYEK